jgi:hypothetical protein
MDNPRLARRAPREWGNRWHLAPDGRCRLNRALEPTFSHGTGSCRGGGGVTAVAGFERSDCGPLELIAPPLLCPGPGKVVAGGQLPPTHIHANPLPIYAIRQTDDQLRTRRVPTAMVQTPAPPHPQISTATLSSRCAATGWRNGRSVYSAWTIALRARATYPFPADRR